MNGIKPVNIMYLPHKPIFMVDGLMRSILHLKTGYLPYLGKTFLGSGSSTVDPDFRTKYTFIRDQVLNDIQI